MSNLRKHERIHSKKKPYTCTVEGCSEAFIKKTQLYRHQLITHEITTPFQCDICSQSFTTQSHLNRHKRKHFGRFMCTDCLEIFDKFSALQKHIAAVHKKELVCPYSYCDKVFTSQSSLNSHLRTVHLTPDSGVSSQDLIEMKCESLGSSSAQQSECGESAVQSECGESAVQSECGESVDGPSECGSSQSVILDTTLASESQADGQSSAYIPTSDLTCNICTKTFKRKSNLTSHKKTVHKITLITEFKCDFATCSKVFNHRHNLIKHIQSKHEGIKQFQCIHCPQQFYHKHAFERHVVRLHQSDKVRMKRTAWNKVSPLENITGCIKNDQVREYVEKMRDFGAAQNQRDFEDKNEDLEKLKMMQRVTECSSTESLEEEAGGDDLQAEDRVIV